MRPVWPLARPAPVLKTRGDDFQNGHNGLGSAFALRGGRERWLPEMHSTLSGQMNGLGAGRKGP